MTHKEKTSKKWFINRLYDALSKVPKNKLKTGTRAYLCAIAKFADKEGNAWPLKDQIAAITGHNPKNFDRYDRVLKPLNILKIKRKYDRSKKMTRKYYKIDIQAVLNLYIEENGSIKIEEIVLKDQCINNEPHHNLGCDQHHNLWSSTNILTTQKDNVPKDFKNIVQTDGLNEINTPTKVHQINEIWFEEFWATYPRKQDKKKAKDVWVRKKLDRHIDIIKVDLVKRMTSDVQWLSSKEFIPLPSTYLNGERWNDEILIAEQPNEIQERQPNKSHLIPINESRKSAAIRKGFEEYERAEKARNGK